MDITQVTNHIGKIELSRKSVLLEEGCLRDKGIEKLETLLTGKIVASINETELYFKLKI